MASLRTRTRKDGSEYHAVLFVHNHKQTSVSFDDPQRAEQFRELVNRMGPDKALEVVAITRENTGPTVAQWVQRHIDNLTGIQSDTCTKYRAYLRNDIAPAFTDQPLAAVTDLDIGSWVNSMEAAGAKAKTIANKHGFLSSCFAAAVAAKEIPSNPCDGRRLPDDDEAHEAVFLSRDEFAALSAAIHPHYRPLATFLVASGCRWAEAVALKPGDVDQAAGTVRIRRAWKYEGAGKGYRVGKVKTGKSRRTINVDPAILTQLDYSHEWLFINLAGGPVRYAAHKRVWDRAVAKAKLDPAPTPHDLRHTCASWMIAAGVPLPVIQDHLGHESITTTIGVYGHLDRRLAADAASAVAANLID